LQTEALCKKIVKQKAPRLAATDTSTFQCLSGNKEEQNKTCWCEPTTDPSNFESHCPEDETSTVNILRESFFMQWKEAQQLF